MVLNGTAISRATADAVKPGILALSVLTRKYALVSNVYYYTIYALRWRNTVLMRFMTLQMAISFLSQVYLCRRSCSVRFVCL